jgi:uncharacterized membrane protein YbhN (UPF0104 family)
MKRRVWFAAKIILTIGLLLVVLRQVDLATLGKILLSLGVLPLGAAIVLTVASVGVSCWRWRRVLHYLGVRPSLSSLFADTLVGATYNLILPTSVGGDVARAVRCGRRIALADRAWASVAFERVVGLLSLVLVSCVGLLGTFSEDQRQILIAAVVMAICLAAGLAFAPAPLRLAARVDRLGAARLGESLERLAQAFAGPLARPAARLETFAWSLAYQFVALSILLVAGLGWAETDLVRAVYFGVPIALVASMIPITVGGLGLRESLFVVVLEPFGVSAERALALSFVWLASNVLVGLMGLVPLLTDRSRV